MSLKDTIRGAREEASANGNPFERPGASEKGGAEGNAAEGTATGRARRSVATAKPRRQAAAGVRVVAANGKSKSKAGQTKEEAKAERKHEREVSDLRYNVTQKILEEREDYNKARKIWWRFLIAAVILMVMAIGLYLAVSNMGSSAPEALGIVGLVVMVAAYGVVIAGMIYDWRVIRPMRKDVDKYVQSMSEKRLVTAINKEPKKEAKKSVKAGKKGK